MNKERFFSLVAAGSNLRIALAIGSLFIYLAAFFPTYTWLGGGGVALVILPVIIVGLLFGLRAGVLAGLLPLLLNALLLNPVGYQSGGWNVAMRDASALGYLTLVAMVDDRVYRKGRPQEEALKELDLLSGQQFDSRVVHAFKRALDARSQAALKSA